DLIGAYSTGGRGLIETLIMVSHDRTLAEEEVGVMAGDVVPDEAWHTERRVSQSFRFQANRLRPGPGRQNKMDFVGAARDETRRSPLRRDRGAVWQRERDGSSPRIGI